MITQSYGNIVIPEVVRTIIGMLRRTYLNIISNGSNSVLALISQGKAKITAHTLWVVFLFERG